jgi:hypothetical protein
MGNTVILTKNHPSELDTIAKAEAYQVSLLGGPVGDQRVKEQHGWWNEEKQKAEWLATTFEPESALPLDEARKVYNSQISLRALQGFVHARSFSFNENKFVYRDLRLIPGWEQAQKDFSFI